MEEIKENLKKKVGKVTEEDRDEIQSLFERKNGLIELFKSLDAVGRRELDNNPLYEKIIADLGKVSTKFQGWWDEKSVKYNWEKVKGCHWQIDFETCDIYLVKGE